MLRSRLSAFFALFFALMLAACSGGKPESVVETFYKAAAKGDVELATKQIALAEVPASEMTMAKGKIQMIVGEMQQRVAANDGLDKVEIVEVQIDDANNTAVVRTKLVFGNGKDSTSNNNLVKEGGDWKISLK
ncbi:DUF4878 domain-containing protein [Kerstersia gyiorum]|uniref:DUF4878 domain-containing protein n=1 Tax=Kerstersia gyiorum TaxID=206506 RepID=UPI00209FBC86|nr:DUF4878 domain-containing protein [Kerstersia gyiorum]MCP1631768.1 hypothetical protein [Kerstersia gyiorum]MCP1636797.1 hypothetical protein [Kerstersia gyiorum]MCP1671523.1 hypothetical protein [Kerstersia gyiorum]MCP1677485.1 hypothetical protein [Kerstersia gyiorum]MCP1681510.1 hypothetical protein [Kerstersia gyiorum]